ncbi:tripartite tricarboxylate transporter TctB family protein [Lentibacillus salicampi]|uniref:Tripartite tricarboxylate transporter TctB family protein n=1 Tax=Lentibacillus salicampi TaxID=175306 RepID=A0A4Y9A7P6_9BACI|nr:tripartite tricarboxylate transporter TctB family protein [Lentibacillus salicampi]TFJ91222.1 tripartite tricarboxylate transporter TctB family protein [Lentibacillus salicampi]
MVKVNYYLAGTMGLLALFFYIFSLSYTEDAADWPQLFSIILILLCVALIVDTHRNPNRETQESDKTPQNIEQIKKVVYAVVSSVFYLLVLNFVGFLLLTPVFLIFLLRMIGYKSWKLILSISIGTTVAVIIIFQYLLRVLIPQGIFEGIIF